MAYTVIARKCRPQSFEQVVAQEHVTRTLTNAIREQRIGHAFLFAGERGVGKTSVARILAKALNCHSTGSPSASPCGRCVSCREISEGTCLDVHEIDGASHTQVEHIRTLRENAHYLPSRDRYKIYIIDEVHMLSTSAFNALLKTLEEPPGHVVFIFATTEPRKIPDTILSRCLRFDFPRIPVQQMAEHLEAITRSEGISISRRGLFMISRDASGSMRDAQTLLERAISYCGTSIADEDLEQMLGHTDRSLVYDILEAVATGDAQRCMDAVDRGYVAGADLKQLYFSVLEALRDMLMIKTMKDPARVMQTSEDDGAVLKKIADRSTRDELLRCFRLCFSSEHEVVRSAVPRVALELCLLEMVYVRSLIPLEELADRIDRLGVQEIQSSIPAEGTPSVSVSSQEGSARSGASSPTPAPDDQETATRDVNGLMEFLQKHKAATAGKLVEAHIHMTDDRNLHIVFPHGHFFADHLKGPKEHEALSGLCKDFFKRDISVTISEGAVEKKKDTKRINALTRETRQRKTLHNPVIKRIVETFNGTIVDIKTDVQGRE